MRNEVFQKEEPNEFVLNSTEKVELEKCIEKFLKIKAIEKCGYEDGQFVSSYFLVPKPDGSFRFILNLKKFNNFVFTEHFKIEDIRTVLNILNKDDLMCRLDLKDAYLLLAICKEDSKYLKFKYKDEFYQFRALPFGLSSSPYIFTKVMKPVVNYLRKLGIRVVVYLDDFLILGSSIVECRNSLYVTIYLLNYLGFIINFDKSVTTPIKICKFLGLIINSEKMQLELPDEKRVKIKELVSRTLNLKRITITNLAEIIGTLVAACPAVAYGWLYYKNLEKLKHDSIILNNYNLKCKVELNDLAKQDLLWWKNNVLKSVNKIRSSSFDLEIFSDASTTGWGAVCNFQEANGFWDVVELENHINYLEIKAAFLGLKCFASNLVDKQILLRIDNITALAYLNKMGGIKSDSLNAITKEVWEWCKERRLWIFAEYVASKDNPADWGSRISNMDTEWELSEEAFRVIVKKFGVPEIDLFASRINRKCWRYCSWERDPEALAINALTVEWKKFFWYAFPPFSLISKVIKKIKEEGSTGILLVPLWPSQPWFPDFKKLLVSDTIEFTPSDHLLLSPCRNKIHPLAANLSLTVGVLSGKH